MHHSGQRLKPAGLIDLVGDRLSAQVERYPRAESPTAGDDDQLVLLDRSGVVDVVDVNGLVALARSRDCRITMVPLSGTSSQLPLRLPECSGAATRCNRTWAT